MSISRLLALCAMAAGLAGAADQKRPLIFNLDASEFFVETFGPVEPKTIDKYLATFKGTAVTDFFVCVNMQRANYRSKVWEADWDGYDPKGGDDQPFFAGIARSRGFEREWYRNNYRWSLTGVDYPERMLSAARANGMRGWISIRMNDAHYPDLPLHPYHSTFWREHPEWKLANASLDYFQPEVRKHYVALIKEVCERYDMHGLELDFMRHGQYFRPENAYDGIALMTELVQEARRVTKAAALKRGYPVKLAVRVPSRPWIAAQRGLDAVEWSRRGLVDLIVASPWWASSQSDVPVEAWRGLVRGLGVEVAVALEDGISSGASKRRTQNVEEARGLTLAMLHRGADSGYLFNWFTGPLHEWKQDVYHQFLTHAGSIEALRALPRRHPVTLVDPWAEGEPGTPRPLAQQGGALNLRIPTGPLPRSGDRVLVALGIQSGTPPVRVRVNSKPCQSTGNDADLQLYSVPAGAMREGYNLLQVDLPDSTALNWAEIRVNPQPAAR
jgi:hypothetical protein